MSTESTTEAQKLIDRLNDAVRGRPSDDAIVNGIVAINQRLGATLIELLDEGQSAVMILAALSTFVATTVYMLTPVGKEKEILGHLPAATSDQLDTMLRLGPGVKNAFIALAEIKRAAKS